MTRGRSPYAASSHPRKPAPVAPRASVADWRAALELGDRCAEAATAIDPASMSRDPEVDLMRLREVAGRLTAEGFPAASPVARLWAGSWLNAARGFTHADSPPEARTACAPALKVVAAWLDEVLHRHQAVQAQGTWARQFGGND